MKAPKDELTPQDLYRRIEVCVGIIIESNRRLIAMESRPINVCMTPTDGESWRRIARKQRKSACARRTKCSNAKK